MAAADLTAARLRELLNYDPATGVFTWRVNVGREGRIPAGSVAGGISGGGGYIMIAFGPRKYLAHRLAWLYMTGEWPANDVDHANTVRTDNRWLNLRALTRSQNNQNIHARRSDNKSGVRGVSWCSTRQRWRATIGAEKKRSTLGYFTQLEDAIAARYAAQQSLHPYRSHGADISAS